MDVQKAPIKINYCKTQAREPGVIYVTTRPGGLPTRAQYSWIVAIAQDGAIVLNRTFEGTSQDIRHIGGGRLLFSQSAQGLLNELDRDGNIVRQWHAEGKFRDKPAPQGSTALPLNYMHHTVNVLPDGTFLFLDAESRRYPGWPTSASDAHAPKADAEIVGDVIAEITPSGELKNRYRLLDMLDPYRISHGSFEAYWRKQGFPNAYDWCHSNAVAHDPSDDTLIVSVRHQDCIVKFRRGSGEIIWILGNHAHWKEPWKKYLLQPAAGLEWQYHQHDCSAPSPGRILCFDNGNFRAPAFETPLPAAQNYSRLVEFEIDEKTMSVRQAWSFGEDVQRPIYGCYQGGALRLPKTGNTFGTFGGVCYEKGMPSDNNVGTDGEARLLEVTPGGEVVFDATIGAIGVPEMTAISAFRATHVPA